MSARLRSHLSHLTAQEQQAAMAFVQRVQHRFDAQLMSAVLFGSRARGEAEPDSDMDVAIVLANVSPELRKEIHYLAVEVWLEHGIYLSTRVWSLAHWHRLQQMQTLLYRNITQDGIDLLTLKPGKD